MINPIQLGQENSFRAADFIARMDGFVEGARAAAEMAKRLYLSQLLQSEQEQQKRQTQFQEQENANGTATAEPSQPTG